jgi:hypothetical protein
MLDKSAYTPLVEGASPDNPIPTIQYPSEAEVHPNREDYDEARRQLRERQIMSQMVRPKTFTEKLGDGVEWIIQMNNRIKFSAWLWIVIFGVFWFSMVIQMYWLPASLSSIYTHGEFTFSLDWIVQLVDFYGVMVVIIFPIYVIIYGSLSAYESIKRWRQSKRDMETQAKFL